MIEITRQGDTRYFLKARQPGEQETIYDVVSGSYVCEHPKEENETVLIEDGKIETSKVDSRAVFKYKDDAQKVADKANLETLYQAIPRLNALESKKK